MNGAPERKVEVVVTGMHRSGTTWFGSLLESMGFYGVIHEPFNKNHGLVGTPRWYLDSRFSEDRAFFERGLRDLCAGSARFRRPFLSHAKMRSLAKWFLGTGAERIYRTALSNPTGRLVLKDPFLLTFVPSLVEHEIEAVIVVRHPAAIFGSLQRMQWDVSLDEFADRGLVVADAKSIEDRARTIATYWNAIYGPALECSKSGKGSRLLFVSHELFFDDVVAGCHRIARFLGENEAPVGMLDYAARTTTATTVKPTGRQVHQLSRDSRTLAGAWKKDLSPSVIAVFEEVAGDKYNELVKLCGG